MDKEKYANLIHELCKADFTEKQILVLTKFISHIACDITEDYITSIVKKIGEELKEEVTFRM